MNMNIYVQELRFRRKTLFIWNLSLFLTLVLMLLIYPAVMSEGEAYVEIFDALPPQVLEALSIDFSTFLSFNGFLGYIFTYVLLAMCVLAMNLGLSVLGKEISGKTADFLLTKPVTRSRLLTEKILSGLTLITLTNLFTGATSVIMGMLLEKEDRDLKGLLLILTAGFILQILFFTLGMLLGILRQRIRFITSQSLGIVFTLYILGMLSQIIKKDFLTYLSPFRYFDFNQILQKSGYETRYLLLALTLISAFTALSYILLERKEIHA